MATENPVLSRTFKAYGDLSTKQYYFVKQTSADTVDVPTAITDVCVGILQNKPSAAGQAAEVLMLGISKLSSNAGLSVGNIIGTSTDGQAQAVASTNKAYGVVLEATSNAGELCTASINCITQAIVA